MGTKWWLEIPKRCLLVDILLLLLVFTPSAVCQGGIEPLQTNPGAGPTPKSPQPSVRYDDNANRTGELLNSQAQGLNATYINGTMMGNGRKGSPNDTFEIVFKLGKTQIITAKNGERSKYCIGDVCVSLTVLIITILVPILIILTVVAILVAYILRRKQKHQINPDKLDEDPRLLPSKEDPNNGMKGKQPKQSISSKSDIESAGEAKPLRNMSEESDLSRSVKMSTSSEKEDENSSLKKPLIKKKMS